MLICYLLINLNHIITKDLYNDVIKLLYKFANIYHFEGRDKLEELGKDNKELLENSLYVLNLKKFLCQMILIIEEVLNNYYSFVILITMKMI